MLHAQAVGEGQVLQNFPLILRIPTHVVECNRLGGAGGEVLLPIVNVALLEAAVGGHREWRGGELRRAVVGDVVAAHGPADAHRVLALGPAQIVLELVAGDVAALGKGKILSTDISGARVVPGVAVRKDKAEWYDLFRGCLIGIAENRDVINGGEEELVGDGGREDVLLAKLSLVRRLSAERVELGIQQVGVGGLYALVYGCVAEEMVLVAEGLVDAEVHQPFVGEVARRSVEGDGAIGCAGVVGVNRGFCCIREARSVLVEVEDFRVGRNFRGEAVRIQIALNRLSGRQCAAENHGPIVGVGGVKCAAAGQDDSQALVVDEEEGLVALDGAADGGRPLVRIVKGARVAIQLVEEVVGVHHTAVPVVRGVAVELVRAGAGDFRYLRAAHAAERCIVGIRGNGLGSDVVRAQGQVAGARVADVEEWIVVVSTVDGEGVRRAGQTKRGEVPILALRIHHAACGSLCDEGEIVPGVGEGLDLLFGKCGFQLCIIHVQQGHGAAGDFDGHTVLADGQDDIG